MPRRLRLLTSLAILLAFPFPPACASEPVPTDLVIGSDTVVEGEALLVPGRVVVLPGATLDLRGTTVQVGEEVRVERGGTLLLGPLGDTPSRLLPLPDDRFHVTIEGALRTGGTPRTLIQGLDGEGLSSVLLLPGGLKVNGTADLRDLDVRDGTAGITVGPHGSLAMRDASFSNLYLMGLAVLGRASLDNVTAADSIIGVTGKGASCRIEIRDSVLRNWAANLQVNGCPTLVERTLLEGSSNNVFNGPTETVLRDTRVVGYLNTGLRAENGATLLLERVQVAPGAQEPEKGLRQVGIEARSGARVQADGLAVTGNRDDGVRASGARVELRNGTLERNGGHGLAVQGASPAMLDAVRFAGNGQGAASHTLVFHAQALGPGGGPAPGLALEVLDAAGATLFRGSEASASPLMVNFEAYRTSPAGEPEFLGPFRYRATLAGAAAPLEGEVPPDAAVLSIRAEPPPAQPFPWLQATALAGGLGLLVVALLLRPRRPARDAP